jgi:hypothetical protein
LFPLRVMASSIKKEKRSMEKQAIDINIEPWTV